MPKSSRCRNRHLCLANASSITLIILTICANQSSTLGFTGPRTASHSFMTSRSVVTRGHPKMKAAKDGTVVEDERYRLTTVDALKNHITNPPSSLYKKKKNDIDYNALLASMDVRGETQAIGDPSKPELIHPVLQLLNERRATKNNDDGFKVALVVEGGGMRGCLSAGMVCAVAHLGYRECFDVLYGSSAGSIIGAYFITNQLRWFGPELYYDQLTTAGDEFIDKKRLLRTVGLGLLDPRLIKDVLTRRANGKPVLNLKYLLKRTAMNTKKLDWDAFREMQSTMPLKVVASGLTSQKSIILDMENNAFSSLDELTDCMHASCLLPGVAGEVMNFCNTTEDDVPKFKLGNKIKSTTDCEWEPMADALIYQPMAYRAAIEEGATHIIVLRTRPDGTDVTGKSSVFERMITRRFFQKKNKLDGVYEHLRKHSHKHIYGEDVLRLNDMCNEEAFKRDYRDLSGGPHIMTIAVPPGSPEVSRLETRRENIFDGVRRGFARAFDAMVWDAGQRGQGKEAAKEYFPDEILEYDPKTVFPDDEHYESAYAAYLRNASANKNQ